MLRVLGILVLCWSCQAGAVHPVKNPGVMQTTQRSGSVVGVAVAGSGLDLRSFVATMAFVFPEESKELVRSLVRTEMAHLEAQRLGVEVPDERVEIALDTFAQNLRVELGPGTSLDDWAQARHGSSWAKVRPLYRRNLADNLLYQVVLRADAYRSGRVAMFWFLSADEQQAQSWVHSLQSGRDPHSLVAESLRPGPEADGSYPPMSRDLPSPVGEALRQAHPELVVGPVQLHGDRGWRVGLVRQVFPAVQSLPPVAVLLEELESHPVESLEARAWFEKMSVRYTAVTGLSPFSGPTQAFESFH